VTNFRLPDEMLILPKSTRGCPNCVSGEACAYHQKIVGAFEERRLSMSPSLVAYLSRRDSTRRLRIGIYIERPERSTQRHFRGTE